MNSNQDLAISAPLVRSNGPLERAKRDGCGCLPWVWCAHFDGQVLVLIDEYGAAETHGCYLRDYSEALAFAVRFKIALIPCRHCGCVIHGYAATEYFPDLPSAIAEFDRREEELIRG